MVNCHMSHRKVHVFSSAKNNIYFINFDGKIGQSESINLSENFRITYFAKFSPDFILQLNISESIMIKVCPSSRKYGTLSMGKRYRISLQFKARFSLS